MVLLKDLATYLSRMDEWTTFEEQKVSPRRSDLSSAATASVRILGNSHWAPKMKVNIPFVGEI